MISKFNHSIRIVTVASNYMCNAATPKALTFKSKTGIGDKGIFSFILTIPAEMTL